MNRAHIAVFTYFGKGHVHPLLPLCTELVKRGHRVTYPTNGCFERVIFESGAQPMLIENQPMPEEFLKEASTTLTLSGTDPRIKKMEASLKPYVFADAEDFLRRVEPFYRSNPPDLILYDRYHIPGRIFARQRRLPAVQMTTHFAYYKNLANRNKGVWENSDNVNTWAAELDSFLSRYGITSKGNYWEVENLNLHFIPKEFQHHSEYFDERFCFTGALLDRPHDRMWSNPGNGKPVILISGMTLPNAAEMDYTEYFGPMVDAFADLPCHCILSLGGGRFSGSVPQNFTINRTTSHLEILRDAALLVGHGGMTSTLEAIYNGVPVLLVPRSEACDEVAYRAEELGLGVRLPIESLSVEILRHTANAMLRDTLLRERVANMRDTFSRSGGATLAADRIESSLGW